MYACMYVCMYVYVIDIQYTSSACMRMATIHHYAYVLHLLVKYPSAVREIIAKNFQEDINFVIPRVILPPVTDTHPLEKRSSICFLKILSIFAPDMGKKLSTKELNQDLL
mmetsp:Transcript_55031/g.80778  ORF Transcript_55031/g.80778 Transcript_55031/m.80778 type:complete len:110 (+) Transcript_55031:1-330(+)